MDRWDREALARLPELFRRWLATDAASVSIREAGRDEQGDLLVEAGDVRMVVVVKGTDNLGSLERADASIRVAHPPGTIALVVVPFMGPKARVWASERNLAWADLSGNADIHKLGLHLHAEGHRNRYATDVRGANAFAPRFSRVARVLLVDPSRWWKQRELAASTGLPEGTVSKSVHRLTALDLLDRDATGAVRARSADLLLDAWQQRYSFAEHDVRRFHAVGRNGLGVLRSLGAKLSDTTITWAATGLSAAYVHTGFADFRLTSVYVDRFPVDPESLGLRPVDRGENVWLIGPRDEGVFYEKVLREVWCVHPVQAYLDLSSHAERAPEAAARLRTECLLWGGR